MTRLEGHPPTPALHDLAPPEFDEDCTDCLPDWMCSPCLATLRETDHEAEERGVRHE